MPLNSSGPTGGVFALSGRHFEVRFRARVSGQLYRLLSDHFGLVLAADGQEPLLTLRLGDFLRGCRFRDQPRGGWAKTSACLSGASSQVGLGDEAISGDGL
jgi:hypothetical protein